MAAETVEDMLDLAVRLATEAGRLARVPAGPRRVQRKPDNSVVTDTDHAIQRRILQAVSETYPGHAVCAEETIVNPGAHARLADAQYCWVVDPLDGTRNFVAGLPWYSTSIAVLEHGRPVVGVVTEHGTGTTYAAVAGGGATMNGQPIRVAGWPADADLIVALPSNKDVLTQHVLRTWGAMRRLMLRNLGSTALHLALVATGGIGAAFARRCKLWDVAAGALLVTEAGGRFTDPFGGPRLPFDLSADPHTDLPFLAGNPDAHAALLSTMTPPTGAN